MRGRRLPYREPSGHDQRLGGAIAAHIHGKRHHVDGSFGNHVISVNPMIADGTVITLSSRRICSGHSHRINGIVVRAKVRNVP
jgi:decaprenylphospho-beta-D-ribofuranose 2-oxidase